MRTSTAPRSRSRRARFPPGLSISDEGLISGTPTAAGSYDFYLTVTYDKPTYCKPPSDDRFIININPGTPRLIVSTSSLPDANINQPYTAPALTASGGTVSSWTLAGGTLPPGLTLNPNGVISGTPTQSGLFSFTVQANGAGTTDTKQLAIFVLAPLDLGLAPNGTPATTQPLAVSMKLATPFAWGVKATGGREPYTYTADALPAGITLNPDGTVTGTPTRAGVTTLDDHGEGRARDGRHAPRHVHDAGASRVPQDEDAEGRQGRQGLLVAPPGGRRLRDEDLPRLRQDFPPGLSLDEETGFLTGTPLAAGTFRVKFWVLGDSGTQVSKTYRIKIQGAPRTIASRR